MLGYISCKPLFTNGLPWPRHVLGSQTWEAVLLSFMAGVPGQGNWATSSTAGLPRNRQVLWMHPTENLRSPFWSLPLQGDQARNVATPYFMDGICRAGHAMGNQTRGPVIPTSTSYLCSDRQTLWSQDRQAVPSSSTAGLVWPKRPRGTSPVKLHLPLPPLTSANLNRPWGT